MPDGSIQWSAKKSKRGRPANNPPTSVIAKVPQVIANNYAKMRVNQLMSGDHGSKAAIARSAGFSDRDASHVSAIESHPNVRKAFQEALRAAKIDEQSIAAKFSEAFNSTVPNKNFDPTDLIPNPDYKPDLPVSTDNPQFVPRLAPYVPDNRVRLEAIGLAAQYLDFNAEPMIEADLNNIDALSAVQLIRIIQKLTGERVIDADFTTDEPHKLTE